MARTCAGMNGGEGYLRRDRLDLPGSNANSARMVRIGNMPRRHSTPLLQPASPLSIMAD